MLLLLLGVFLKLMKLLSFLVLYCLVLSSFSSLMVFPFLGVFHLFIFVSSVPLSLPLVYSCFFCSFVSSI